MIYSVSACTTSPYQVRKKLTKCADMPAARLVKYLTMFSGYGLKWTRTTDLTLIRRAL